MRFALIALALSARLVAPAMAVGFQHVTAADPDDQPLEVGIWYPSEAPTSPRPLGFFSQTVAVDGPVAGDRLRLILFSHGNGGSFAGHYDTALTLAKAGFVVASVTHTGDNFRDQSKMSQVVNRPRHVSRVLDYMLAVWPGRDRLDPDRVGIFGFSSGGFTALVSVGAVPDMARLGPYCAAHRQDFACRVIGERRVDPPANSPPSAWIHDVRIKAAVVAAPALSLTFTPAGLSAVKVPVQLWRPAEDELLPHPYYAQAVYDGLSIKPDYHVVPNAGHFVFVAPCSESLAQTVPEACRDPPGFDRVAFHQEFNTAVVAFFKAQLPGRN